MVKYQSRRNETSMPVTCFLVRNRAKEIVELLGNTDKIRSERKLAKKNRNKYTGVGSDSSSGMRSMGLGGTGYGGGSKYVGFGSDSYSGGGGISFNGDALSFGEETPYPHQSGRYDEDDDEDQGGYRSDSNEDAFASSSSSSKKATTTDDFDTKQSNDDDWGDFTWGEPTASAQEAKPDNNILDDDFADFQHAVADEPAQSAAPKKAQQQDLFDLLGDDTSSTPATSSAAHPQQHSLHMLETKQPVIPSSQQQQQQQQAPKQEEKKVEASTPTGMWAQASNFVSLDSLGKKTSNTTQSTGPSINALKNTSVQADWNNWASKNPTKPAAPPAAKPSSAFDDLLL